MSSLPLKILVSIVVATFTVASTANAAKKNKHKSIAATATRADSQHRETRFPPVHFILAAYILAMIPTQISAFSFFQDISDRLGGDD